MSLNSRIKERREQLGLSRINLAEEIGVTPSAISNYENAISSPKPEILNKLFVALKCDANYLYQDDLNQLYNAAATPDEFEKLVEVYRALDHQGRNTVDYILKNEKSRVDHINEINRHEPLKLS